MKICHVITRMIVGGAQENTLLTVIGHAEKGHDVTLITGPSPGPEGELLKQGGFSGFKLVEISSLVREINPVQDLKAYYALKKIFTENQYDVVHTHSSKAGIVARAAATAANVKFVVHTVHGQPFHRNEKPWKNWLYKTAERWAAKRCHKIYSVCQAMIDQCVEANVAPKEKYKVVFSGMDLEPFLTTQVDETLRDSLNIPKNATVVGAIARLFPLKGYEYFIPLAIRLAQKYDDIHFLIIGNGEMREDIDKEIAAAGVSERFSFSGLVPPSEIYRYTALMNMLVHLSMREGLPRTVVQALASGKPAIGFNLDGTPEVILDGKTGFILEAKDVEGVEKAIETLYNNPELASEMGAAGRELVKNNFDWHLMSDILEEEYKKGLGQ